MTTNARMLSFIEKSTWRNLTSCVKISCVKITLPPPSCSDERAVIPTVDAEGKKNLIMIFHDESIFSVNERQSWIWGTGDHPYIQPKTKGAGIMVSDFITRQTEFLRLSDHDHAIAKARRPDFPRTARVLLEYGGDKEGYWTGEKLMDNVKDAASIADFLSALKRTPTWCCLTRAVATGLLLRMHEMLVE